MKYIIEVEDKPFKLLSEDGFTSEKLFRVKGFNSLVFDWNGLNMLTPYTAPDLEQVREEAYKKGLSDAWAAARTLWNTPNRKEIFGYTVFSTALMTLTGQEAIEKIRQYEQEKEEDAYEKIKVGDEVVSRYSNARAIVVSILNDTRMDMMNVIRDCGDVDLVEMASFKRTGRHFPEIAEILQKMKEES